MKLTDFKKTPYKYEMPDGREVLGETRINGERILLVNDAKGKIAIKARGIKVKCLDIEDEKAYEVKVPKQSDNKYELLEQRITQLESLLNIDKGKDKII